MDIARSQSDYYVIGFQLGCQSIDDIVRLVNGDDFYILIRASPLAPWERARVRAARQFRHTSGKVGRRHFARLGGAFPGAKYLGHNYFIRILQAKRQFVQ
jgi:hypothetical protein